MAKKIKFPLIMDNGEEVRDLDGLKRNFSLLKVIEYLKNGKLVIWLRDRYYNELAESVEEINIADDDVGKKLCVIFDVEYSEKLQEEAKTIERFEKLKKYTNNENDLKEIDKVAFDQNELNKLIDEGQNVIYLCGSAFSIPLDKKGICYIGINEPVVIIDSKVEVNWKEKKISFNNILFDDEYRKILESSAKSINTNTIEQNNKSKISENLSGSDKSIDTNVTDQNYTRKVRTRLNKMFGISSDCSINVPSNEGVITFRSYDDDTFLNAFMSDEDKKIAQSFFTKLSEFGIVKYNKKEELIDSINDIKRKIEDLEIIGLANKYFAERD